MSKRSRKSKAAFVAKTPVLTMPPKEKPVRFKLVTDTSCQGLGKMTWENVYNLIEKEKPRVIVPKAIVPNEEDSDSNSETQLSALANSFLHRVAARANIFPYYDVIRWVIDNVTIQNKTFVSTSRSTFRSFRVEDIKAMCHLPKPQNIYNKDFLKEYAAEHPNQAEPIK